MTIEWSDDRLDAALRELLHTRAAEIDAAALPVDEVSAQLADQLGVTKKWRRPGRQAWRNSFMSNALKFATAGAAALLIAVVFGLYMSQPGGLIGPPVPSPSPTAAPTPEPTLEPTPVAANPVEIAEAYIEVRLPDVRAGRSELPLLDATTNALVITTGTAEPRRDWGGPMEPGDWVRDGNVMTFVYVDRREVVARPLPELVFGSSDIASTQLLAGDRLVFFGATEIYAIDPDPAADPEPILAMSSDPFITPSGLPDRIWVFLGTLSGPAEPRLLQINSHGEVVFGPVSWPHSGRIAGMPTLVVSDKEVSDPVANRVVLRLPGGEFQSPQVVAGSSAHRFTWCETESAFFCKWLHVTDLDAGITRTVAEFPDGEAVRFRPDSGRLSPDGRYLAASICVDDDRACALAVLDLEANRSWTVADGWLDLFLGRTPVWSPDGQWVFFQLNDGRLAAYSPGDVEAQIVDVPALDPAIGFTVMAVPDDPVSEHLNPDR